MRAVQGTPTHQREAEHSLAAALSFFAMKCLISRHAPCWRRSRAQIGVPVAPCISMCLLCVCGLRGGLCSDFVPTVVRMALCKVWNLANSFTPLSHARDTRHTRAHKHTHSHTLKIPRSSAAQSFDIELEAHGDDEGEGGRIFSIG